MIKLGWSRKHEIVKESNTEAFCLWSCYRTYLDTAALLCKAILVKDNTVLYIILYPDEISDIFASQNKIEKKVNCKKKVITKYLTQMFQASNNQTYFHHNHQKFYLPKPENFLNKEKNFQKNNNWNFCQFFQYTDRRLVYFNWDVIMLIH